MEIVMNVWLLMLPLLVDCSIRSGPRGHSVGPGTGRKYDIRKCCAISEVLVEQGPGKRVCTGVDKIGGQIIRPMQWRGKRLQEFAIFHGQPHCGEREHLVPLYHVGEGDFQTPSDNLDLRPNGSLVYRRDHTGHQPLYLSDDKYCVDKLFVGHNYSHVGQGEVANFAYVCLDLSQTVAELVETLVYPVGVAVSMGCLTLTFLLYSFLPQLRDLTGKFILGICAFLTANYALRLVDLEILGFKDPNIQELATELVQHSCEWTSTKQIGKQLVYNRSMQHFQINFDLFTKLFMVIGACWLFQTLALLEVPALDYIGKIFTLIQGPLIFVVAMCRTRVLFLFKKYFCQDKCCLQCCRGNSEFIELPATELATIDKLREAEQNDDEGASRSLLDKWTDSYPVGREMSKSLFNVRSRPGDESDAPETPLMKVGRLLKASSLAAMNIGWRRETAV